MTSARLPHSETPGSKSGCRLPEAYRRLPRPSSAPDAKASTVRPKKLEHTQRSETTQPEKHHNPPPPKRAETNCGNFSVKRCSRPLYSSQTTTSTPTPTPMRGRIQKARNPEKQQPPTPPPKREGRAARFLRTQQRVHQAFVRVRWFPSGRGRRY